MLQAEDACGRSWGYLERVARMGDMHRIGNGHSMPCLAIQSQGQKEVPAMTCWRSALFSKHRPSKRGDAGAVRTLVT